VAALGKETILKSLEGATKACSNVDEDDDAACERAMTLAVAAIERLAPPASYYVRKVREISGDDGAVAYHLKRVAGLLRAFEDDVKQDRVRSVVELVHAEVFSDFLDMAQHLLEQGFKDGAAVIAGSALEAHIRALCQQVGIETNDAAGKPKKADTLNAELDKAGVYGSKLDLKNVVAWLDLRNKAAHGEYAKYEASQVSLLIASVRDFMTRFPA
jgi:hypothetical protein